MWRELLKSVSKKVEFNTPASPDLLEKVSKALNVELPSELAELLLETDGVKDQYSWDLVWPCERIIKDNLEFRTNPDFAELYMSFESLLFFGADAGSDHFAFVIHKDGKIYKSDIFVWNHENDNRMWVANTLDMFLEKALKGKIKF